MGRFGAAWGAINIAPPLHRQRTNVSPAYPEREGISGNAFPGADNVRCLIQRFAQHNGNNRQRPKPRRHSRSTAYTCGERTTFGQLQKK